MSPSQPPKAPTDRDMQAASNKVDTLDTGIVEDEIIPIFKICK